MIFEEIHTEEKTVKGPVSIIWTEFTFRFRVQEANFFERGIERFHKIEDTDLVSSCVC